MSSPRQDSDRDFCVDLSVIEMVSVYQGYLRLTKVTKDFPLVPINFSGKKIRVSFSSHALGLNLSFPSRLATVRDSFEDSCLKL